MEASILPPRYADVTLVAHGGMGEVYRAEDTLLGRIVAVKVLADRHARNPDVAARFAREGRAAALLSAHPNVVTVFDVGEHRGRPFIVMEYLDGGSVHEWLRGTPVPRGRALEWLRQTASALDAAHARGVVHRDVKPANLLLDGEENVHVSDFGIASAAGLDTLTIPGTVLGTAGYLSPEQARGEPASPASDRYALGVVAFELLTGRRPFVGDTPVTEAFAHINAEVPRATSVAGDLPPAVDDVLRRALAKSPEDRPRSAGELAEDLRLAFRDAEATTAVLLPPHVRSAPPRRGRDPRRLLVPLVLLALIGAGVAAAALLTGGGDSAAVRTVTRVRTAASSAGTTRTVTETATVTLPSESQPSAPSTTDHAQTPASESGAALNDSGYQRMQAGDFVGALPILEQAVSKLQGTGSIAEAYASYNLAFTRFALGRCDGVLELLQRSRQVQGHRSEIDRLWREAVKQCRGGEQG